MFEEFSHEKVQFIKREYAFKNSGCFSNEERDKLK